MSTWTIDTTHSGIHFSVRHLMVAKVRGRFATWSATFQLDEDDVARSTFSATIATASIDTQEAKRDEHLRSADFFDAAQHPDMTFRSTKVERSGPGHYRVEGDLSIRGTTRPVILDLEDQGRVKDPWGNSRAAFTAQTSVDRRDFGLTWNMALEAGGFLVGDKVDIQIEVEAVQAQASAAA